MASRHHLTVITLLGMILLLPGCATMEYYAYLEPKRSTNAQFIDMPYVYSGYSTTHQAKNSNYQFSGVLLDTDDKYLDININKEFIILSNTGNKLNPTEPALLVVNPNYPFDLNGIKNNPVEFFQEHYLKNLLQPISHIQCPQILILNIDIYEEQPTTLELGRCSNKDNNYTWQNINPDDIQNSVEHNKPIGYQLGYLGFLVTLPLDLVVTPIYSLAWGISSSKNLLFSGDE